MFRRLLIVLSVLAVMLSLPLPAAASPSGLHNVARARTSERAPDSSVLAWAVVSVDKRSLTAVNRARASAHHCQGCTAVAVAWQVIIASDTSTYVLTNNATSINRDCETCTSVAIAEQWVAGDTSEAIQLTAAGQSALAGVNSTVAGLLPTPAELLAQLPTLEADVGAILSADVVVVPKTPKTPKTVTPFFFAPTITVQHYAQVSG